ncbi:MAG TPA: farnesyl diphosphate synthase [Pirellulales bacterium]|jgi:geranylgeranyl diphosphate synthase type II|nr:farnesyl diphosphate synthase [Pirellulales bacterium]
MLAVPRELSSQLSFIRARIDAALDQFSDLPSGCPPRLKEAIRYSLLAVGKRLRPILALFAAEACGGEMDAAMPVACATEMIHCYSLIHDDLPAMDDDDLRRGRPTCHKAFDEATAILAGDALLTLAFEVVAKHTQPPELAAQCCAALAEAAGATALVGGQADDLAGEFSGGGLAALESIHRRKTGAMINVPLQLGGLVAGAAPRELASLADYGRCLGLAFQITDDLLDVRGTEANLGKRVQKDSQLGKLTFPGLLGIEESQTRAAGLVGEAIAALAPLGGRAGALEALARYVLERNH